VKLKPKLRIKDLWCEVEAEADDQRLVGTKLKRELLVEDFDES